MSEAQKQLHERTRTNIEVRFKDFEHLPAEVKTHINTVRRAGRAIDAELTRRGKPEPKAVDTTGYGALKVLQATAQREIAEGSRDHRYSVRTQRTSLRLTDRDLITDPVTNTALGSRIESHIFARDDEHMPGHSENLASREPSLHTTDGVSITILEFTHGGAVFNMLRPPLPASEQSEASGLQGNLSSADLALIEQTTDTIEAMTALYVPGYSGR